MLDLAQGITALDDQSNVIGTALWFEHDHVTSIGAVLVDQCWQRQGIGQTLMSRVMAAASHSTFSLVATRQGEPLYHRMGFKQAGTVRKYQGRVDERLPSPSVVSGLRRIRECDIHAVATQCSATFLSALARQATDAVLIERQGHIHGTALCRPFGRGLQIGPVIAQDAIDAWAMIEALLDNARGQIVRLDIADKPDWETPLAHWGMSGTPPSQRLSFGPTPPSTSYIRFGLTSQAIG
nr:GNAT family N-acetyltransferase [Larsenimonas suaedae]